MQKSQTPLDAKFRTLSRLPQLYDVIRYCLLQSYRRLKTAQYDVFAFCSVFDAHGSGQWRARYLPRPRGTISVHSVSSVFRAYARSHKKGNRKPPNTQSSLARQIREDRNREVKEVKDLRKSVRLSFVSPRRPGFSTPRSHKYSTKSERQQRQGNDRTPSMLLFNSE